MLLTIHLSLAPARPRQIRLWPLLVAALALWRERRRTRRHLGLLNDRELADVGITRAQQCVECAKPFWRL
ncbi:MAG: DUF1127 domain-containing protein [Reyranella sp.]|nr:DUF1127 domain-containing protein [Reyranella sp.]